MLNKDVLKSVQRIKDLQKGLEEVKVQKSIPGPKGDRGERGEKGEQGQKGLSAYDVWVKEGHHGSESDFLRYIKGDRGERGPQGLQGVQGQKGEQGQKGDIGPQGTKGQKGDRGDRGVPGPQGEQGVKGKDGKDGTSINILGSLENEVSLPRTGELGEGWLINGYLYVWDTKKSKWINVGSIKGPKGNTGDRGQQGDRGEQGPKGDMGSVGPVGPKGDTGERGLRGEQGIQGVQGPRGERGHEGPIGSQGDRGERGKSAYETWTDLGNKGSEQDFINSLKGKNGESAKVDYDELKKNLDITGSKDFNEIKDKVNNSLVSYKNFFDPKLLESHGCSMTLIEEKFNGYIPIYDVRVTSPGVGNNFGIRLMENKGGITLPDETYSITYSFHYKPIKFSSTIINRCDMDTYVRVEYTDGSKDMIDFKPKGSMLKSFLDPNNMNKWFTFSTTITKEKPIKRVTFFYFYTDYAGAETRMLCTEPMFTTGTVPCDWVKYVENKKPKEEEEPYSLDRMGKDDDGIYTRVFHYNKEGCLQLASRLVYKVDGKYQVLLINQYGQDGVMKKCLGQHLIYDKDDKIKSTEFVKVDKGITASISQSEASKINIKTDTKTGDLVITINSI